MSKGITVVEKPAFTKAMDKNYYVKGFDFITVDEAGQPFFKLDERNKVLKTNVKFITDKEGEETPAMSVTPAEFVALVHMLGGTDFQPTFENRTLAPVMIEGRDKANKAGKMFVAESKNGWVNTYSLPDLHPPEGLYRIKFKGAFSPDHPNSYNFTVRGENSGFIILRFEIVDKTMWEGFEITLFLNNTWVDYIQNEDGTTSSAIEDGRPLSRQGVNLDRWLALFEYFAPGTVETHEWKVSPSESQYGVCEVTNPQYVLINKMLEQQRVVNAYYEKRDKKNDYWFDPADLKKNNVKASPVRTASAQDFADYVARKEWTVTNEAGEPEVLTEIFTSISPIEFVLNEKNESVWARNFMSAAWEQAGLDMNNKDFNTLSSVQVGKLLDEMEAIYGK